MMNTITAAQLVNQIENNKEPSAAEMIKRLLNQCAREESAELIGVKPYLYLEEIYRVLLGH